MKDYRRGFRRKILVSLVVSLILGTTQANKGEVLDLLKSESTSKSEETPDPSDTLMQTESDETSDKSEVSDQLSKEEAPKEVHAPSEKSSGAKLKKGKSR